MAAEVGAPDGEAKAVFCDVDWWSSLESTTLAQMVADTVFTQGYCLINMCNPEEATEDGSVIPAAQAREDWTFPHPEFEVAYVGYGPKSKVVWLEGPQEDPLQHYIQEVKTLSHILLPTVREVLRFKPGAHISGTMLRMPFSGWEEPPLGQEPLSEEEVRRGFVEKHLDFVQRRRLCMLYMIESGGGTIGLYPRADLAEEAIRLPISKGKLLVFRHDLMGYSYEANGWDDLVLQSWFMEEPQQLYLGSFEGDQGSLEAIFGGPPQRQEDQVHIMSAMCHYPGLSCGLNQYMATVLGQTDCFVRIPVIRWDVDQYFTPESGQFATTGKSVQQHAGLLEDRQMMMFDNEFFGIAKKTAQCMPPNQRVLLETAFDMFISAGFTRKSLEGVEMCNCVGDIGAEWEGFRGHHEDPEGWLKSGATGFSVLSLSRLCYTLGLRGPCWQADTACSASLVAANICHSVMLNRNLQKGYTLGQGGIISPWPYIGLSAAGMIGRAGRCMTFNSSANGFARGEGVGGLYMTMGQDIQVTQDRLACYVSSYTNQDGRSASLTAPNGPSQQLCIRNSLRWAGLQADQYAATENHGTGTALGDPIETGSIARIFQNHPAQLPVMSVKTLTGHLECTAGVVSLLKTINILMHSVIPSNNHLRVLNEHMADDNFPGIYPNELCDNPQEHSIIGMNAFGFGGTNSRAELWAPGSRMRSPREIVQRGIRGLRVDKLGPAQLLPRELERLDAVAVPCARCLGPMCWLCAAALQPGGGKHYCSTIRDEFASYDTCSQCYAGGYQHGTAPERALGEGACWGHGRQVSMVGTWSAWSTFAEMQERRPGVYVGEIALSDLRVERFHLVVDKDRRQALCPVVDRAKQTARVVGPGGDGEGRSWLLDGRRDGQPAGAVYEVTLEWGDQQRSVTWKPTSRRLSLEEVSASYQHTYSIARSSSCWKLEDMQRSAEDPALWTWRRKVPGGSREEFHFVRDRDRTQTIYPLQARAVEASVPVMGPDAGGEAQGWLLPGAAGDAAVVELRVEDGAVAVRASASGSGAASEERAWRSAGDGAREVYFVAGSWNAPGLTRMLADEEAPDVHRCQFAIGPQGREEFHVVVNCSTNLRLYPASAAAPPGDSLVCGPGKNAEGFNWEVQGPAGQVVEIVLNLSSEDNYAMLSCVPCVFAPEEGGEGLEA